LWEVRLWGILYVNHSFYINRVRLELKDNVVVVYGREDGGDYVECLDKSTGRRIAHRVFRHYSPKDLKWALSQDKYRESKTLLSEVEVVHESPGHSTATNDSHDRLKND
jgi:hypothetical protein